MMKTKINKHFNKFVIMVLIFTLTFGNWGVLGGCLVSIASSNELELQNDETKSENVKFDIGILENEILLHSKKSDINDTINLQSYISVENEGVLRDITITFSGENETNKNFDIIFMTQPEGAVKSSSVNKFELNQISEGNTVKLEYEIQWNQEMQKDLSKLNKNNIVKLSATYVDSMGKEVKIDKNIMLNIEWTCENEIGIKTNIDRYASYEFEGENGVVITQNLTVSQTKLEAMPFEKIIIEAEQIQVGDVFADSITVKNGNNDIPFEIIDNKIKITDENKTENDIIQNTKTSKTYDITYVFKNVEIEEKLDINTNIKANAKIYSSQNEKTTEKDYSTSLEEKVGNIVDIKSSAIGSISKGKIYANYNQEEPSYETTYSSNLELEIAYKHNTEQIKITDKGSFFTNEEGEKYDMQDESKSHVYYKATKINKSEFEQILGEDGFIKIIDTTNNEIAEINKNTQVNENGEYYTNYENNVSNITIITSEIMQEGTIEIKNEKSIAPSTLYKKEQVQTFKYLEDEYSVDLQIGESTINIGQSTIKNELQESKTEAILTFNNNKLSSISKNENIELKIELKNNVETSDLYKNPSFEIELPKEISRIDIKDSNILFDEELQIESVEQTNKNGKIVISIKLKGTQTKFLMEEYINGTTIVLNTDIEVDIRTSSKIENVIMKYYNENANSYNLEAHGEHSVGIEFISPIGMIIGTELTNYNADGSSVMSVLQGPKTGKLEIYTDAKNVQSNVLVVNNTGNTCDELTILGRLPFKDNKNIATGENLGTTTNTKLSGEITTESKFENIEIYYSDNGEATTDLSKLANNWTKDFTALANIKSFMIKVNETIAQSDIININYNFEIPANLEHNAYMYQDIVAYYNNNREIAKISETTQADIMCLTTGKGPQMEIEQTASIPNGGEANEGQKIKYTIKIKNTGIDPIYNLKITDILPENAIYTVYTRNGFAMGYDEIDPYAEKLEWNIEKVEVGETVEVQFQVEVNSLPTIQEYYSRYENFIELDGKFYLKENEELVEITEIPTITMTNRVAVNAEDLGKELYAGDYENIVKAPEIIVTEEPTVAEEVLMREGQELTYHIRIKNNKQEDINNINLSKVFPEGLEFEEIYTIKYNAEYEEWEKEIIGTYDESTKAASLNIGTIPQNSDAYIKIKVKTSKLAEEEYNKDVETITKITGDNIGDYTGDVKKNTIAKPKLETEYICKNDNKYIEDGEIVEYSIKVTNVSNISANNVEIKDVLPEGLEFIKADYTIGNFTVTTQMNKEREIEATCNIMPNETLTLNIKAKAVSETKNINVENTATINSLELGSAETETLQHIVEAVEEEGIIAVAKEERKYTISGQIWYDQNRDGLKEVSENAIPGTELMVINADTGTITQKITADDNGKYYINDLSKGNYVIICKYDNEKYQVTEYKKLGVAESNNSDVIAVDIEENGEKYIGAVTDIIRINNEDYSNIDMGLSDKLIFDLKLNSELTKMTLQNEEGIKEVKYENVKLPKIDINPDLLSESTVYIEYKITITNEGNVPGYANNIVNYIPKGTIFNSELNTNWYIGQDGNLYSNALADELINPGETKEIKLILIKEMTEENTGMSINKTEIHEIHNEYGLQDIDSKENNKSDTEDDYSEISALITLQLGGKVVYSTSVFGVIIGIAVALYFVQKYNIINIKLNKKRYK